MPQFDFSTYPSQIFWFGLCFLILFLNVYFIITPRIQLILNNRKKIINSDLSATSNLNDAINKLKTAIHQNNQESQINYQQKIESTLQKINSNRQEAISNLKKSIDENSKKSRKHLQDLVIESQKNSDEIINKIAKNIKSKILN
jgi:F-type H+-transporting ATPase subunit b